jgi:hypothetical protein
VIVTLPSFPATLATAECSGVGCEYFSVTILPQYESISAEVGGSFSASFGNSAFAPVATKLAAVKVVLGFDGKGTDVIVESRSRVNAFGVER